MGAVYALADANNFYVACERLFNPQLAGIPVVVLSNNDGCVVAASPEAKKLGIVRGTPHFMCAKVLRDNGGQAWSSNYALYANLSQRVVATMRALADEVEEYSIDESFVRITDNDPVTVAALMRATVLRNTGIAVSLGIGATKTLAKVANKHAKKSESGVLAISSANADAMLDATDVSDVWGIGGRRAKLLNAHGISTARQLRDAPDGWVRQNMTITGLRTVWELRGIGCISMEYAPPPKQSIACTRSFGRPVTELGELREAVSTYVTRAAEKLRAQAATAGVLQVFIHTNHFTPDKPQYTNAVTLNLPHPTADTTLLSQYALYGLAQIFRRGYEYKKAGVILLNIGRDDAQQLTFLGQSLDERERRAAAMLALDTVNQRWGRDTLRVGSSGIERGWTMRRSNLSPHYTTRWDDVPIAHAK